MSTTQFSFFSEKGKFTCKDYRYILLPIPSSIFTMYNDGEFLQNVDVVPNITWRTDNL